MAANLGGERQRRARKRAAGARGARIARTEEGSRRGTAKSAREEACGRGRAWMASATRYANMARGASGIENQIENEVDTVSVGSDFLPLFSFFS